MDSIELLLVKDVTFDTTNGKEYILQWPCIELEDIFVFYNPLEEKLGFDFLSLQIVARELCQPLLYPENSVEILYWGNAYFDGIRHLYLGSEETGNYGYINYPSIKEHLKILEILQTLEQRYCRDANE